MIRRDAYLREFLDQFDRETDRDLRAAMFSFLVFWNMPSGGTIMKVNFGISYAR